MRGLNSETFDLIYLDPPFNSKRDYAAPIGSDAAGAAFEDTWSLDDVKVEWAEEIEVANPALWHAVVGAGYTSDDSMQAYLTFMAVRLLEMRRLLKNTGSIYLHCDPTASHYLKQLMDAIFGHKQFRNEIVWEYSTGGIGKRNFPRKHDVVLFYSKSKDVHLTIPRKESKDPSRFNKSDSNGDRYYEKAGNRYYVKDGVAVSDVWMDIAPVRNVSKERTGYPTQKPLALLERIIKASSNKGDMVLDPFCGCATTCVAAEKLDRKWVGIDIEETAQQLVVERLTATAEAEPLLKTWWQNDEPPVTHRHDIPKRTDPGTPTRSPNIKQVLFRKQNGRCAGLCHDGQIGREFPIDIFEIDHIKPRSKGGPDIDDNLQLLCSTCNGRKGNRTMVKLLERNFQERASIEAEEAAAKQRTSQIGLNLK